MNSIIPNVSISVCSLVIGYYAHFLWQVEDDEEEAAVEVPAAAMVAAF